MALVSYPNCGREVSTEVPACPSYGRPWPGRQVGTLAAPPVRVKPPSYNGVATTSFVLGLVGILCMQPLGIGAVLFGPFALGQLNRQRAEGGSERQGRALAIVGIATGAIAIIIFIVVVIVLSNADWEVTF